MASLYDINFEVQIENLAHPYLRLRKALDYLFSLIHSLQYSSNDVLGDYRVGVDSSVDFYDNSATYQKYDKIIWDDDSVYECIYSGGTLGIKPIGNSLSTTRWRKYLNSYIGADERAKYSGQMIKLCYMANKKFRVTGSDLIYFSTFPTSTIWLRIHVPTAVYNALASTNDERDKVILTWLSKYVIIGVIDQTDIDVY